MCFATCEHDHRRAYGAAARVVWQLLQKLQRFTLSHDMALFTSTQKPKNFQDFHHIISLDAYIKY